jgi:hypothetical protein
MFSRRTRTTLMTTAVAAALAVLVVGPAAGATTQPISSCGQTVTTNAVVTQDLDCAGLGIVDGALAIVKSTTASGNSGHGIDARGDAATLKGNSAYGNGLPGGVSDGWGMGIFAGNFVVPPVGTKVARGNDDPAGCNPSALC